jgi:serine/threonine-protein phosphatase 2A regulatory subunit B''
MEQGCWKDLLESYISTTNANKPNPENQEKESIEEFLDLIKQEEDPVPDSKIPKFYYKKPASYNDLYFMVKSEGKSRFLSMKSFEIPQKKHLKDLWMELKASLSPPLMEGIERINYRDFKKIGEKFGPMFSSYFKACTFLKFDKDKYGRIEIMAFFHYVVRKTNIEENKVTLSLCDLYCEGFLTDKDLETFIKDEIRQFYFYEEISEDIKEYYLLVAQRKFFFFLDPKRTGKIYIKDIITSNILTEFNEMKERAEQNNSAQAGNWFSLGNFWRIYKKYIDLDKDKNGMLSKEELIRFGPGLTMIFIDRIFEEYQKYENAIDFKQFIDFVLALENRKAPASIQYIWRAIDVYHKNAVDTFVINMFYRQVVQKLVNRGKGLYKIDDIKDEIWDMIKPKNSNYITLQDILASSYSDTVLSLIIDAKAFFHHDQKESQLVEEFEDLEDEFL